jgi:uncharacterized protein YgbK (DUF1537 family)
MPRQAAVEAWAVCDVLLQTPEDRLDRATCPPSTLLAALADLALALVARRRPDGIFLSGGDTARAVLGAAGVTAVRLRGEVLPGAPWGLAAGGALDGVMIVSKAGAFGGDEDLVELHRRCREGARHD